LNKNFAIFVILEIFFCSTLSEFQNFLVCERILINLTTCQNEANFKDFQRFGAFGGLVEQKKNVVFNSFLCNLGFFWHEWASLKLSFHSCQKKPKLHTNSLNKLLFFPPRVFKNISGNNNKHSFLIG
jgi:hypothetical protein